MAVLLRTFLAETGDKSRIANAAVLVYRDPDDGELYLAEGDGGGLNNNTTVVPTPILIVRDGIDTEVTLDTATPANNRPLPTVALAGDGLGPLAVGAGTVNASTQRFALASDQAAALAPQTDALTDTQLRATPVPVSVSGVATEAKQDTGNTSLAGISTKLDSQATAAKQDTMILGFSTLISQTDALETTLTSVDTRLATLNTQTDGIEASLSSIATQTDAVEASLSSIDSKVATETTLAGIRTRQDVVGHGSVATAQRVAAQLGVGGAAASAGAGAADASTQRVILANESGPNAGTTAQLITGTATQKPYYQDFGTTPLTTSYTEVIASTAAAINAFTATNNSPNAIAIATGAAAAEVIQYIVAPGENTGLIKLLIAAGTRIAIKTMSGTSGDVNTLFILNAFN